MPRNRPLKIAALAALYVLSVVAFVAWFQRPGDVLTIVSGPDNVVVPRDGDLAWTVNLPVAADVNTPRPTMVPEAPGLWSWRDSRTLVFTPRGALPADRAFTITFPERLRAVGGFSFKPDAVPQVTVRTAPALTIQTVTASTPAFGLAALELRPNRVPTDSAALMSGITVTPAVEFQTVISEGSLRLLGAFVPGSTYHVAVRPRLIGKADDMPMSWSADVVVPKRTPGARLVAGARLATPQIEAIGLDRLTVEATGADGSVRRDTVVFTGEGEQRIADLPAWLVVNGRQQVQLQWSGGQADVTFDRQDLALSPSDVVPVLWGSGIPVVVSKAEHGALLLVR